MSLKYQYFGHTIESYNFISITVILFNEITCQDQFYIYI
jgi:hypothetical protein